MEQYISKSALVAEVKRLIAFYSKEIEDNKEDPWAMDIAKRDILQEILSFLDTLEMKDVDFEKELDKEWNKCEPTDEGMGLEIASIEHEQFDNIAKHFFELGMSINNKAQKGE